MKDYNDLTDLGIKPLTGAIKKDPSIRLWEFLSGFHGMRTWVFEGSHQIHTPRKLVSKILDQLDLTEPDAEILVLFNPEFAVGLRDHKVSMGRVTFYSDHEMKTEFATQLKVKSVITSLDELDMKFDIVIGNPPFQNSKRDEENAPKSANLWSQFLSRSIDLLKNNGQLAMITSGAWTAPGNKSFEKLMCYNLYSVLENVEHYFTGVSLHMTCVCMRKDKKYSGTKIIRGDEVTSVDITGMPCFVSDPIKASIVKKTLLSNGPRIGWKRDCKLHTQNAKPLLKSEPDKEFNVPVVHTNRKTYFTRSAPEYASRPKIWTTISSYYHPKYETDPLAFTENVIFVEPKNNHERVLRVLQSKLYHFMAFYISRPGGFMTMRVLDMIPAVDFTKDWSDAELYKHFELTQDEIDLIETTVK